MKMNTTAESERRAALRRAIIRVIPGYYAWPPAEQERFRLRINLGGDLAFRIRQSLLRTLFGIEVADEAALDECLSDFDDAQSLLLNSTLLPFQGIGDDDFFLNEHFAEGVTLLDFDTLGDYAKDDHAIQEAFRKKEDPGYAIRPYRGDLFSLWARMNIEGEFHYATLYSLAGYLRDVIEETLSERVKALIPYHYVAGEEHGKREGAGTLFDMRPDAGGMEPQLNELRHRCYRYEAERYESLLDRFDGEGGRRSYIQPLSSGNDPHVEFVFSDKGALDAVRFRSFYSDCRSISADTGELEDLMEQERNRALQFVDGEYRDVLDHFDPKVVRLRKRTKVIVADGAFDGLR